MWRCRETRGGKEIRFIMLTITPILLREAISEGSGLREHEVHFKQPEKFYNCKFVGYSAQWERSHSVLILGKLVGFTSYKDLKQIIDKAEEFWKRQMLPSKRM